jgi:hypothetical protein
MLLLGPEPLGLRQRRRGHRDLGLELPHVELRRDPLLEPLPREGQRGLRDASVRSAIERS